jgi:hypothetical protein
MNDQNDEESPSSFKNIDGDGSDDITTTKETTNSETRHDNDLEEGQEQEDEEEQVQKDQLVERVEEESGNTTTVQQSTSLRCDGKPTMEKCDLESPAPDDTILLPQNGWSPPTAPVVGGRDFLSTLVTNKRDDPEEMICSNNNSNRNDTLEDHHGGSESHIVNNNAVASHDGGHQIIVTAEIVEPDDTNIISATPIMVDLDNKDSGKSCSVICPCCKFSLTRKSAIWIIILIIMITLVSVLTPLLISLTSENDVIPHCEDDIFMDASNICPCSCFESGKKSAAVYCQQSSSDEVFGIFPTTEDTNLLCVLQQLNDEDYPECHDCETFHIFGEHDSLDDRK